MNVAYRWFLGVSLTDKIPDASTISQNRRRRFVGKQIHQLAAVALGLATTGAMFPAGVLADQAADSEQTDTGHHRLELSYTRVDAFEGDADLIIPGYTLTLTKRFRIGIAVGYYRVDLDDTVAGPDAEDTSGWGDSQLVLQWDPGEQITSSPWVPDRLGAYTIVTAPTGNRDLSDNQWRFELGFGAPAFEGEHFVLLPSGYFRTSFEEKDTSTREREVGLIPGLYWVINEKLWLGYTPGIAYNFTFEKWAYDHALTAGWLFRSGLGIGFSIAREDRIDPGATSDSYTGLLDFYFVFGKR